MWSNANSQLCLSGCDNYFSIPLFLVQRCEVNDVKIMVIYIKDKHNLFTATISIKIIFFDICFEIYNSDYMISLL